MLRVIEAVYASADAGRSIIMPSEQTAFTSA
jgi:hypothetical protein